MEVPIVMLTILVGFALLGISITQGVGTAALVLVTIVALVALLLGCRALLRRLLPTGSADKPVLPINVLECKHVHTHQIEFGYDCYDVVCEDCGEVIESCDYDAS